MRGLCLLLAGAALAASPALSQGRGPDGPPGKGGGGPEDKGGPQGKGGPEGKGGRGGDRGPDRDSPGRGDRGGRDWDRADRGPPPPPPGARGDRDYADARGWEGTKGKRPGGKGWDEKGWDGPQGKGWGPDGPGPDPKGKAWGRRDRDAWFAGPPRVIEGCPPGAVRRGDACLLPTRAQPFWGGGTDRYDGWYGRYADWRRDPQYDYRYDDGYLYRTNTGTNIVSAFLPLLGGALFGGNIWPQAATDYQVPDYYGDYFGYNDGLDYRYGDGAILGVNPASGSIDGIAALLTGNQWAVGQAMPAGYDFYNVPPQFRDRYADSGEHLYRYSDGQLYDVDPTTRIVQQIIQLVT
ncbi:hypothetical protein [uncultured Sphingomonas sp.]|uniref:hypothetical protein n=1 Tax=uncultured Sphingomonas sp. TaxID=158754 RepID=UPI0025E5D5FD|nr:hypothetical protein [uncultured Sphingomonas sp.]